MSENITLQVSNLVLPESQAAMGGIATHETFLRKVEYAVVQAMPGEHGYDGGYEVIPTRALTTSIYAARLRGGKAAERAEELFSSVHQTWGANDRFGVIMMRNRGSLQTMEKLSAGARSAVAFGETRDKRGRPFDFHKLRLKDVGVQLTVDVFDDWDIDPADVNAYDAIPYRMAERGLDNVVVDPFHLYRCGKQSDRRMDLHAVLEALERNNVSIRRIHFRGGNADFPPDNAETIKDLDALLAGYRALEDSMMGSLALHAAQIWGRQQRARCGVPQPLAVVNEVTASALRRVHDERRANNEAITPFTHETLVGYHAAMAIQTREFFKRAV